MKSAIEAVYHIRCAAAEAEARALAVAVEQSVEMPVVAIEDERVLGEIVGEVRGVRELKPGLFEARIGLNVETTGHDAGQLINMLFGNASLLEDVVLADASFPAETLARVPELLDFYGAEVMLLIGGNLLAARERLVDETAAFVSSVERYSYG